MIFLVVEALQLKKMSSKRNSQVGQVTDSPVEQEDVGKSVMEKLREHFKLNGGKRYSWGHWGVVQRVVYVDGSNQYVTEDFAVCHLSKTKAELKVFVGDERKLVSILTFLSFKINLFPFSP